MRCPLMSPHQHTVPNRGTCVQQQLLGGVTLPRCSSFWNGTPLPTLSRAKIIEARRVWQQQKSFFVLLKVSGRMRQASLQAQNWSLLELRLIEKGWSWTHACTSNTSPCLKTQVSPMTRPLQRKRLPCLTFRVVLSWHACVAAANDRTWNVIWSVWYIRQRMTATFCGGFR